MNLTKSKIIMYTIIGLMSLILVYVMFIQFRIVKERDTEEIDFMRETELRETLADYKAKYKEVEDEYLEVQKKIDEYKKNEQSEEETEALLEKELEIAKMKLGITDVYGEGVTITMQDTNEKQVRIFRYYAINK